MSLDIFAVHILKMLDLKVQVLEVFLRTLVRTVCTGERNVRPGASITYTLKMNAGA